MLNYFQASSKLNTNEPQPPINTAKIYGSLYQSNGDGRGDLADVPSYLQGEIERCFFWSGTGWTPLTASNTSTTGQFSYLAEFGYRMSQKYKGENHYFVFSGEGGLSLENDFDPNTGVYYSSFISKWNNAVNSLDKFSLSRMGMMFIQGENDSSIQSYANNYQVNEVEFINSLSFDTSTGKFINSQLHDSLPVNPYAYSSTVIAAKQTNFANGVSDGLINTNDFGLNADSIHYNTSGLISLGQAFAEYF